VRLVHYSVCRVCGEAVPYAGRGRPKQYCPRCKEIRKYYKCVLCGDKLNYIRGRPPKFCEKCKKESNRILRNKYMQKYRKKLYKMIIPS